MDDDEQFEIVMSALKSIAHSLEGIDEKLGAIATHIRDISAVTAENQLREI